MTDAPHLLVTQGQGILIATLNRPKKLNAMSIEMVGLLSDAVTRFRDSPELKVMLIRATGPYFSSGADLKEGGQHVPSSSSEARELLRRQPSGMRRVWDEIERVEKPFVIAHQGRCVGGGLELSLSCDFRLAAASATYAFPEGKFGLLPATNGISRLTRVVGPAWARYLVMGNAPITAPEAWNMGLVQKVLPDASFEEEVVSFCRQLSEQDGEFMAAAKVAIELSRDLGADQAGMVERLATSALMIAPGQGEKMQRHLGTIGKSKI